MEQELMNPSTIIEGIFDRLNKLFYYYMTDQDDDRILLLEGEKGTGKSTLAITFAQRWQSWNRKNKLLPVKFDVEKNIIYDSDPDTIRQKLTSLPKYSPIIFDEGGRIALAENWNKKEQKDVKQFFGEFRTKHFLVIINSPYAIEEIDKKYLKNFIHYWVHLWGKGYATVFQKNLRPLKKGFGLQELDSLLPSTITQVFSLSEFKKIDHLIHKHSSYLTPLYWRPLPTSTYEKYLLLRDQAVYGQEKTPEQILGNGDKRTQWMKFKLVTYVVKKMGIPMAQVERDLGVKPRTLSSWMSIYKRDIRTRLSHGEQFSEEILKWFNMWNQ